MIKPFLKILAAAALTAAAIYPFRYYVIEPQAVHEQCVARAQSFVCMVRQAVIYGFAFNLFGICSVIFGVAGLFTRHPAPGYIAVVLGVTGALLYRIEFAGVGLLLGALALARPSLSPQHAATEQQA